MLILKFISSLTNKEKAEVMRSLADVSYRSKGIVFDTLHELAAFIEREPDKKDDPVKEVVRVKYKTSALELPAIELTDEEKRIIADGQLMRAVRMVRERTAQRLRLCHQAVLAYEQELRAQRIATPNFGWAGNDHTPLTDGEIAELRAYAGSGDTNGWSRVRAIQWVRDHKPGTGLKEAKEYIESLGI